MSSCPAGLTPVSCLLYTFLRSITAMLRDRENETATTPVPSLSSISLSLRKEDFGLHIYLTISLNINNYISKINFMTQLHACPCL